MKLSIFVFLFIIIVSCIKIFSVGSNQLDPIIKVGKKGINLAEETNYGRIEKDVVEIQQKTSSKSIIVNENLVQFSDVFKEHKPGFVDVNSQFVDPYQDNDSLVYEFTEEIYDSSSYLDESTEDIQPSNSVTLNSNDDEFLSNQNEEEYVMLYEAGQIDDSFILLDE